MLGISAIIKAAREVPLYQTITITTQSTSASWSITNINNTGAPLLWQVSGGVTIPPIEYSGNTYPTFNLSSNSGTSTITISSTDSFAGLSLFEATGTEAAGGTADDIRTIDATAATSIITFSVKGHLNLPSVDTSTMTQVEDLTFRTNISMTAHDLSANTALVNLWIYGCSLSTLDLSSNTSVTYIKADNNNFLGSEIDQILIDLDNNGQSNGTLVADNNTGNPTSTSYNAYASLIGKGWTLTLDAAPPAPSTGNNLPILTTFRVEDANKDRIYFDVPLGPVTGLTTQGLIVSGNTVSAIDTVNNYITVGTAFDFYDNNTIRLESGDGTVYDFTMEHIKNNINEPTRSNTKWVSVSGSGSQTGDSEANSLNKFILESGMVNNTEYRVKAGNYGNITIDVSNRTGVSIVGYKTTWSGGSDVSPTYNVDNFSYPSIAVANSIFDSTEMPYIDNARNGAHAVFSEDCNDIIIKNIQIENSTTYAIDVRNTSGEMLFENIAVGNIYPSITTTGGIGFFLQQGGISPVGKYRMKSCVSFDASDQNFAIKAEGGFCLVENCKAYTGQPGFNGDEIGQPELNDYRGTDYHYVIYGANNTIIKDSIASTPLDILKRPHAMGIKEEGAYCLFVDSTVKGGNSESLFYALSTVNNNVSKRIYHEGKDGGGTSGNCIAIRDGAHDNIVENCLWKDVYVGFALWKSSDASADIDPTRVAYNNTFRNNILSGSGAFFQNSKSSAFAGSSFSVEDNTWINNTWVMNGSNDDNVIHQNSSSEITFSNNVFHGNIIESGDNPLSRIRRTVATAGDIVYNYNDFSNCPFATPSGTGNLSLDAQLDINNIPQNVSLIAAPTLVDYDYSGDERNTTTTTIGAEVHASEVEV